MATIIVGYFQTLDDTAAAARQLAAGGIDRDRIAQFYRSPDGHHVPPTDESLPATQGSAGSEAYGAGSGAAQGAGVGAAIGLAGGILAAPVAGPIGPVLGAAMGAYAGSLAGALQGTSAEADGPTLHRSLPHGGPVVAVALERPGDDQSVVNVLIECGALQIERAIGTIVEGDWRDYDPSSTRHTVVNTPVSGGKTDY